VSAVQSVFKYVASVLRLLAFLKRQPRTWAPSYVENVSQSDLLKMLRAFLNQFLSALKYKHSNKYLLQWLSGNT
ncbi:hypothetical protein ABTA53_17310, partial [Acinetobacter baumannii]